MTSFPVFDLASDRQASAAEADPEPSEHSVATVVGVILGVIALVIGLSVFAGGGSGDDDAGADDTTSTTTRRERPTGTTLRPPPAEALLEEGQRLDPAFGLALVFMRSNGMIVVADLATGAQVEVDESHPAVPLQAAQWTGEMFLLRGISPAIHRLVPASSDQWEVVETTASQVDFVWPNSGGLVWLWFDGSDGTASIARVETQGGITLLGPATGGGGHSTHVVDGRPVFSTPDGVFLLEPDGTPRRYAYGTVFGAAGSFMVRRVCDDLLQCRLVLDEVVTRTEVDLGPSTADAYLLAAVPAPDGSAVALVEPPMIGADISLRIIPTDGSPALTFVLDGWSGDVTSIVWSADNDGLVWWDERGPSIRSVRWRNGDVSTEPASVEVNPRIRLTGGYVATFLVPLDQLPSAWVPGSG